ncbi:MAG: hypothetical protein DMG15_10785 [Acidobacteria bacterium]|nr:MAG: hypothetical protein DMG16_26655 [Acidobacteriota bacterium]PYS13559.1 MAG: hypothetical protein DMG15_10785 [Acidobacteriota bacterium]
MKHPDYIGKYVIEEHLGGGMSNVYRARDPILEKTVAIKIMTVDAASDPESRSRFLREARLAAGLANVGSSALASVKSFSIGDSPYGASDFAVSKTSHSRSNNF